MKVEGREVGYGYGYGSTLESKYRYRNAGRKCPSCGAENIRKSKNASDGFYCWEKTGGCGSKFKANDPAITNQTVGKVDNPDAIDAANTVLKMTEKRSFVDACLNSFYISDLFTQDIGEDTGGGEEEPPPAKTYSRDYKGEDGATYRVEVSPTPPPVDDPPPPEEEVPAIRKYVADELEPKPAPQQQGETTPRDFTPQTAPAPYDEGKALHHAGFKSREEIEEWFAKLKGYVTNTILPQVEAEGDVTADKLRMARATIKRLIGCNAITSIAKIQRLRTEYTQHLTACYRMFFDKSTDKDMKPQEVVALATYAEKRTPQFQAFIKDMGSVFFLIYLRDYHTKGS